MWIERDLSSIITARPALGVLALVGVRQCGKSSMLRRLGHDRRWVSLDDAGQRDLANDDPELFLRTHPAPLAIDECQLAPPLFPALKRLVDERRQAGQRDTAVWLTGSHQLLVDARIKESLAGRVTFRTLHPLSVAELARAGIDDSGLFRGGMPELYWPGAPDPTDYHDAYVRTVLERDVVLFAGIEKVNAFSRVTRLLAARIGGLLNQSEVGREAGVATSTVGDWVSALERMGILHLVPPYTASLSARLVKTPKAYLCDTGLAARLQGWTALAQLVTSPLVGPLFENLVFLEILKARDHHALSWTISSWRTRDGEEVDFVVEGAPGRRVALEVKRARPRARPRVRPRALEKALGPIPFWVVSELGGAVIDDDGFGLVGVAALGEALRRALA